MPKHLLQTVDKPGNFVGLQVVGRGFRGFKPSERASMYRFDDHLAYSTNRREADRFAKVQRSSGLKAATGVRLNQYNVPIVYVAVKGTRNA